MLTNRNTRSCPACGSAKYREWSEKAGFALLVCKRCGTLYTGELPSLTAAENYDDYYDEGNLSAPDFIYRRLEEIVATFSPYRSNNRLLELGFGAGSLMQVASRSGWTIAGVEISRPAVDHARQMGFDIFEGEIADAKYPTGHFDVVVASELLEHVPNPAAVLKEVARILRPGGLFWATTPNGRGISGHLLGANWSTISPPEHIHLFSRSGISRLLHNAGFSSVHVATEGVNPVEIFHWFRGRNKARNTSDFDGDERVKSGYQLNASLMKTPFHRFVKEAANSVLRVTRLGDSLKVRAQR